MACTLYARLPHRTCDRGPRGPPRGVASTPQRPPPPQRPPDPKSLLLERPRKRSLRHLRGPEPPIRRLQPILPPKPPRTAATRAEERRCDRVDRSSAEEAIEHPLVSAVPEQPRDQSKVPQTGFLFVVLNTAGYVRKVVLSSCRFATLPCLVLCFCVVTARKICDFGFGAEIYKGRARRQTDEQQVTVRATSERG